ncbi:hypothetical protein O181_017570 [Austropuccinia psidii MF-1]|uniref:Reverse transcriptase Ty1/copia-type domain-containing protein n=1 Tax=Austropuccinia psidii MF-1 TaxID=1389203 RepID=A0A9Q3C822_9BASI|nr:hypothetical protein [Austropuccinia psidii MF-1]
MFGEEVFIHIQCKKCRKIDDCAVCGHVLMYLPNYKGWVFIIEDGKSLIKSAWLSFSTSDKISYSLCNPVTIPPSLVSPEEIIKKGDVNFLLNTMCLGDFKAEQEELIANNKRQIIIPKAFCQAMWPVNPSEWQGVINAEVDNMQSMGVFEILPLHPQTHLILGGWVFAIKVIPGVDLRYKSRYVAHGSLQHSDMDFKEKFAPTASFSSLQLLLTLAAPENWAVANFDFVSAYLDAPIS